MSFRSECCRWERCRYAVYSFFQEPKLYRMAVGGDWDCIPQRVKTHPKEVAFVHSYAPHDTALHRILKASTTTNHDHFNDNNNEDLETRLMMQQIKFQAIEALVQGYEPLVTIRDAFGRNPFHLTCMLQQDNHQDNNNDEQTTTTSCGQAAILQLLIHAANTTITKKKKKKKNNQLLTVSDILAMQDVEGRTPLHYLVARCRLTEEEGHDCCLLQMIRQLIELSPSTLELRDVVNETPWETLQQRVQDEGETEQLSSNLITRLQSLLHPPSLLDETATFPML